MIGFAPVKAVIIADSQRVVSGEASYIGSIGSTGFDIEAHLDLLETFFECSCADYADYAEQADSTGKAENLNQCILPIVSEI